MKKLLPGFIPLFVFIAADEIWGTKVGLFVAIGVGLAELIWIAIKEKRFEKFVLFDTLLLVVFGLISIILANDIFFKLKPGLVELILVAVLAISAFSKVNLIGLMGKRYLPGTSFSNEQLSQMRNSLKNLFYIFLLHTLLVFYAAFFIGNKAWAYISGGLFYILFGVYFLFELIRQRKKQQKLKTEEWVPLVDEKGKVTGQAPRSQVHNGSNLLHPVVHLHVLKKGRAILLQKRAKQKQVEPGKWDVAVGGHISVGENLEQALKKEALEEIGLKDFSTRLQKVFVFKSALESELVYLFTTFDIQNFKINPHEVEEIRFWTKNQVEHKLGKNIFTPNFEYEYSLLKELKLL